MRKAQKFLGCGIALFIASGCTGDFLQDRSDVRKAEVAFNAETLKSGLRNIESWHVDNGTGLVEKLGPGLSVDQIDDAFDLTECKPTNEMKILWSWNNGATNAVPFVWYHDFLSMEEAISEYNELRSNLFVRWDPEFMPIFSFDGEWYASYCGDDAGLAGPVVHVSLEDEPRITHVNITTFVASMSEALQSKAVQWIENNKAMVEDIRHVYQIHQKFNKDYPFPYYVPDDT